MTICRYATLGDSQREHQAVQLRQLQTQLKELLRSHERAGANMELSIVGRFQRQRVIEAVDDVGIVLSVQLPEARRRQVHGDRRAAGMSDLRRDRILLTN